MLNLIDKQTIVALINTIMVFVFGAIVFVVGSGFRPTALSYVFVATGIIFMGVGMYTTYDNAEQLDRQVADMQREIEEIIDKT